jgi:tRNA dimethylallyltransferase
VVHGNTLQFLVRDAFFIVGPTAVGKSELAADVAIKIDGEIVSADAFQVYRGLELLTAKPARSTISKAPHHLIGTIPITEEMNAEKFRRLACRAIDMIRSRGKQVIVVGGSGLYLRALTHGLSEMPPANRRLRDELHALSLDQLQSRLRQLDPETAGRIDLKNRRRLVRALEVCLLTGKPMSAQKERWNGPGLERRDFASPDSQERHPSGVFVFRDRDELYQRIDRRVREIFEAGVVEEVAKTETPGGTAGQMIGLTEIRQHLKGELPLDQCIQAIQQATRQYAKRQLTWFRRQTSFDPLNLSLLSHNEAVEWISRRATARRAQG